MVMIKRKIGRTPGFYNQPEFKEAKKEISISILQKFH